MSGRRILVVDDEQLIRWSLRERLSQAGYSILEAETGKQALQEFRRGVDLVVLDMKLPDTDGLSVLGAILRISPGCPVILMTALGAAEMAREAARQGAFRVVDKPFDVDAMIGLIEEATNSSPDSSAAGG